MYTIKKKLEISAAHCLNLSYPSPCANSHGHNWIIQVSIQSEQLNADGMVLDFTILKKLLQKCIHSVLDHSNLNQTLPDINPTAENIATWIAQRVEHELCCMGRMDLTVSCVEVQETEGNVAIWQP